MAGVGFTLLKRLSASVSSSSRVLASRGYSIRDGTRFGEPYAHIRPAYSHENRGYHVAAQAKLWNLESLTQPNQGKSSDFPGFPNTLLNSRVRSNFPLISVSPTLTYHSFWSSAGKNEDSSRGPEIPEAGKSDSGIVNVDGIDGGEWGVKVKDAWRSIVDGVTVVGDKVKESYDELIPHGQQVLDTHPYLRDLVVSVGGTLTAATMAWLVMPVILKRFHKYSQQGTARLLSGTTLGGEVPYEKSVWGALEDPVRYSLTFLAFTQIGMILAPDTITPEYVSQALRGAAVMSLLWFLYRWKTNIFSRALTAQSVRAFDREKLVAFDKVTSVGIVFLGMMALAEAFGVAFQSILTVGGIGGVATAFAAKDVLGNVLSGLSMQFSRPFSLGDTIKAGSIEGQVVEMGLTTTSLLNAEKFPVIVPNSLFSSQVIVNKSRAQWRAIVSTIPLQFDNLDKIPQISDDIKSMLRSNPKVFLGKEAPYCFLSRIESSFAELTLGCNLKHMSKDELVSTKQDILLQTVEIIKQHGATLGSTWQDAREP